MISEKEFASSCPDFWQELLPLLTPSLVHILHAGHEERLHDTTGNPLAELALSQDSRSPAAVSEFAFHLAKIARTNKVSILDAINDTDICGQAVAEAIRNVSAYEGKVVLASNSLNSAELGEGRALACRYDAFISWIGTDQAVEFSLGIPGAGSIKSCVGDMAIGDYFIEVKTVRRSLASKDIRQLVVYLALYSVNDPLRWVHAGFFNPRRSTFHKWETGELIRLLSGRSSVDVFSDIIDFACSSDLQLDSPF